MLNMTFLDLNKQNLKMRIHLRGFKCYQDKEFNLLDGQLLLFSGPSGIGKSTVFQSIYWCLYGTLRNVYSNVGPPKCSVLIQFSPDFTVFRQASPRLLQVTETGSTFEDQVAQQIINERFGSPSVFLACCYLQQDEKCSLLSKGFSERTDILNSISFSGENPEKLIASIEENLKALTVQSSEKENTFKILCEQFTKELEQRPIEQSILELTEPLDSVLSKLKQDQTESSELKSKLEKELVEQTKIQGILENLKATQAQLEKHIDSIPLVTSLDLSNLEKEVETMTTLIPLTTEYNRLSTLHTSHKLAFELVERQLSEGAEGAEGAESVENVNTSIDPTTLTEHLAWSFEKQEKDYETMVKQAKLLNLTINSESDISTAVEECQNLFTQACLYEKAFASYSHFQTVCKHLSECQKVLTDLELEHSNISLRIQDLETQKAGLTSVDLKPLETRINLLGQLETQTKLKRTLEQSKVQLDIKLAESQVEQSSFSESKNNLEQVKTIIHYLENLKQLFQDRVRIVKLKSELELGLKQLETSSTSSFPPLYGDTLSSEIASLGSKLVELKKASDILPCPHCSKGVKYFQGKLHACQESCVSQAEIDAASKELQKKTAQLTEFRASGIKDQQIQTRKTTILAQLEEKQSQLVQISSRIDEISSNLSIPDLTSLESVSQALLQCTSLQNEYLESEKQFKQMKEYYDNLTFETRSNETQLVRVNSQIDETCSKLGERSGIEEDLGTVLHTAKAELCLAKQTNQQCQDVSNQIEKFRSIQNQTTSNLTMRRKMFDDLQTQKTSFDNVNELDVSQSTIRTPAVELKSRLTRLTSLVWSPKPPMSSKLAFKFIERKTKFGALEKIVQEMKDKFKPDFVPEKLDVLNSKFQKLKMDLNSGKKNYELRTQLQKQIWETSDQIETYTIDPTLSSRLLETTDLLNHSIWMQDEVLYTQKMKHKQSDLTTLQDECVELQNHCTALSKLKHIAVLTECQQLQSVVDSINACMELVFRRIFDDPITVRLRLFKTLKSDGRTKPNVNLSILYKGAEYDSISQLSGGESARISMGVVLALNRVVGGNLLMLDECFGGLNGDLREESLKCIRELVNPGTTVCVISHEDNEADYDSVIGF